MGRQQLKDIMADSLCEIFERNLCTFPPFDIIASDLCDTLDEYWGLKYETKKVMDRVYSKGKRY